MINTCGNTPKNTLNLERRPMVKITHKCRKCAKMTKHLIRIVTDTLPPNVKVVECCKCGVMGIALIDEKNLD